MCLDDSEASGVTVEAGFRYILPFATVFILHFCKKCPKSNTQVIRTPTSTSLTKITVLISSRFQIKHAMVDTQTTFYVRIRYFGGPR